MSIVIDGRVPFNPSAFSEFVIPASQIPDVVKQWDAKAGEADFAVLMFKSPYALAGEDPWVNLQYSVQDGDLGIDWVLLGSRNIEDRRRISEFMSKAGYLVMIRETNDVLFLRVEDGDVAALGLSIVTDCYQIDSKAEIRVLVNSPTYQSEPRPCQ